MPENSLDSEDVPKHLTQVMQEPADHLMMDDWFIGVICCKISPLFPPDGQGLLQHDEDRSEGKHY
jgi:hypothetical protein